MAKLILTQRDEELFQWLWMLRVMTVDQARRILYYLPETGSLSNLNNVRMRLKRLEDAGYLRGELIREEKGDHRQKIYFLDQDALFSLRALGIFQRRVSAFKDLNAYQQIYHALMVSECAARVWEQIRATSFQLAGLAPFTLPFYHTHAIGNPNAKRHVARFISQVDLFASTLHQTFRIRPDLVFALQKKHRGRLFFLEADRGFEGHAEIRSKQEGYFHYATEPQQGKPNRKMWQTYGEFTDFRVLFVSTTERRIENLRSNLHATPGFHLWAMTTFEALKKQNPVFDPIWKIADGSKKALMRREQS